MGDLFVSKINFRPCQALPTISPLPCSKVQSFFAFALSLTRLQLITPIIIGYVLCHPCFISNKFQTPQLWAGRILYLSNLSEIWISIWVLHKGFKIYLIQMICFSLLKIIALPRSLHYGGDYIKGKLIVLSNKSQIL